MTPVTTACPEAGKYMCARKKKMHYGKEGLGTRHRLGILAMLSDGLDSARRETQFCRGCVPRTLYLHGQAGLKRSASRDHNDMFYPHNSRDTCL